MNRPKVFEHQVDLQRDRADRLAELLKEAVKIIHCHQRNLHKDFLQRARYELKP
jgi:hypothetical protein